MRSRSRATSPTRAPPSWPQAARRVPDERLLVETDAPYLTPQAVRKRAQPAGLRRPHRRLPRRAARRRRASELGRDASSATRRACSAGDERRGRDAPVQPSLRRMRQFAVRPDRELGQNFLIDSNILGVIGRAAELDRARRRARDRRRPGRALRVPRRARRARARGRDRRAPARGAAATRPTPHANVSRALGGRDADRPRRAATRSRRRSSRTCPTGSRPGCCCARSRSCRASTRWVAMVQREVGERLAAAPGSGAYGVPSVLAQLACEVRGRCGRSRAPCSSPVPERRLGARRHAPARAAAEARSSADDLRRSCARSSRGAFAHRRKTLAGSLALSGERRWRRAREQVREALEQLGHPADVRAERLSPEDFRALARLLEL